MKLHQTDHRATTPRGRVHFRSEFVVLSFLILVLWQPTSAQQPNTPLVADRAPLTAEEVVHNLVQMNLYRVQALHAYQGTRTYRAEYHGLAGARTAEMVVSVQYRSPGTKEFIVQSATGSKLIIDRVFRKLLEAEKEALDPEIQRRSALTDDNYRFTLIGYEAGPWGPTYVLKVEPRTKDKFLYRGRIWVDADDFAVVRLEAEPTKSPSFWTKKAEILHVYMKVNDFWLPAYNRSVTAIRLGGHAELTIDYKDYEITGTGGLRSLMPGSAPHADTAHAQK